MKRALFVIGMAYLAFVLEVVLFRHLGVWGKPEFLVLVIVFFTLYLGIRYGMLAAFVAGILREGVGLSPLGMYIFIYIVTACLISLLRRFFFQPGSRFARIVMAFFGTCIAFMIQAALEYMSHDYHLDEVFFDVFVPQLIVTTVAATIVFTTLKKLSETVRLK